VNVPNEFSAGAREVGSNLVFVARPRRAG